MANIARLGVVLGLNTAEFQAGLKSAMQGLEKLEKSLPRIGLAAAAAGTGLALLIKKGIDELDKLDEVSQKIGITVESLSSLGKVAKIEGMSIDDLAGSLVKLTRTISEANSGSESAAETFKSMGLDPSTFKNSEDALLQISDKFAEYRDGLNKTALAVELFGKSGADMIPFLNQGSDVIKEIRGELDSFGNASSKAAAEAAEFNDRMSKMGTIINTVFQKFVSELLPTINNFTEGLYESYKNSDLLRKDITKLVAVDAVRWAENLAIGLAHVLDSAIFVARAVLAIGSSFRVVYNDVLLAAKALEIFSPKAVTNTMQWWEELKITKAERDDVVRQADELYSDLFNKNAAFRTQLMQQAVSDARMSRIFTWDEFGVEPPKTDKPDAPPLPKTGNATDKTKNMLSEAQKLSGEFERERNHSLEMMRIKTEIAGLTQNERRVQESVNEVLDATSKKLQDIADKREAAAGRDASAEVLAEYDKQAEAVKRLGQEYAELARTQETSAIEAQRTFSYGWEQAFKQYAENAENYSTMAGDMFQAVTGAMSTAIDNFVESGKFSFKDFTTSIIKDLIKIELKMAAMQLFRMGFQAIGGAIGGGIGGASVSGIGSTAGGAGALSFPVAANGGTINSPTLVGERGPEIFMPGRSGAIIPNNNIGDMMGNNGGITYNGTVIQNMQAIDTQSGLQFLAKNKMNIYALNQSASRSMPTSR
jgi:lambda family phage tail tape measure protein